MSKMIAYCGFNCIECPVYIATQNDDEKARKDIVEKWNSSDFPVKAEDLYCDGCILNKKHAKFWMICEVRVCAEKKNLTNCAYCDDYPCTKLNKLYKMFSSENAKQNLTNIREEAKNNA